MVRDCLKEVKIPRLFNVKLFVDCQQIAMSVVSFLSTTFLFVVHRRNKYACTNFIRCKQKLLLREVNGELSEYRALLNAVLKGQLDVCVWGGGHSIYESIHPSRYFPFRISAFKYNNYKKKRTKGWCSFYFSIEENCIKYPVHRPGMAVRQGDNVHYIQT